MSDADLNTQQLCDRLNALSLQPGLDNLSLDKTVELWWEGWRRVASVRGYRRTSYVFTRSHRHHTSQADTETSTWVWLTVPCGTDTDVPVHEIVIPSSQWDDMDRHARALACFYGLAETLVTDAAGLYLAVKSWANCAAQQHPTKKRISAEGVRLAGSAADLLSQLNELDVDRDAMDFVHALRPTTDGPFMPYP